MSTEHSVKIMTLQFGEQEISPDSTLHFADGLPGFETLTDFQLFHEEGQQTVHWLQAVDAPEVTFAVAEPHALGLAYELTLSDAECESLQPESSEDVIVLLMLSRDDEGDVHIHRNAPLIINSRNRKGLQKTLTDPQEFTLLRAGA